MCQYSYEKEGDEIDWLINLHLLWEKLKCSIRGKTISFSAYLKKENQNTESNLEEELTKCQEDFETTPSRKLENQIKELEEKLKTHREKQINAIMTRAKARWEAEGEKCTNYFCNLEERHYNEKMRKLFPN